MSRLALRISRLLAAGVPALLLVILIGCGRQSTPEPAAAEASAPEAKADLTPKPSEPLQDEELTRLNGKLKETLREKSAVEVLKQQQKDLRAKSEPVSDSIIMGGDGKAVADPTRLKPQPKDGYNAQNAEVYGVFVENDYRSPLVAPVSTFSADVNTASYANVRRMLNDQKLPPANAVLLAEFVNYFSYSYAKPQGDDPVAFNVEMGPCPWNRKHHLVRVGVQSQQIPAEKMPPRNLVFLIDTSGSMQEENRLPLVQKSLALLVNTLTENDRVSVVTYAGDSRVALNPTKGSDKKAIISMIESLSANGSTDGEGGIRKAYDLARETFINGGVNRVILCTDGDFNVGVTDNGELVKLIEEQRKSKVFLTILGFGMGNYKDDRLKELANHGNGHHAYIDTVDEAKKVFVEQGGSLVCVAKDVKFQVDFNPAKVNAYRLIGYENRLLKDEDFKNDAKDAGDMGSGHQVTVFYEIVPKGVDIKLPEVDPSKYQKKELPKDVSDEWLTVKMRYKHPEAETSKELSQPLKGDVAKDLSEDFRFAAAVASFGMILRDSKYRGAMTYAGVLEEAKGCIGADPNGHRAAFVKLVERVQNLTDRLGADKGLEKPFLLAEASIDDERLREIAKTWGTKAPEERAKLVEELLRDTPPKYHQLIKGYFAALDKAHGEKK